MAFFLDATGFQCVQTDGCMTSAPYVFETLSRYFKSKQYSNTGQDASAENGTVTLHNLFYKMLSKIIKISSFMTHIFM